MIVTPLVNLNGTSAQELIDQQSAIAEAADHLIKALSAAMPHGRDYHLKPGPENWTELARREHAERIACARIILSDAHAIALSVMEQAKR